MDQFLLFFWLCHFVQLLVLGVVEGEVLKLEATKVLLERLEGNGKIKQVSVE